MDPYWFTAEIRSASGSLNPSEYTASLLSRERDAAERLPDWQY
jgi:hypothetical protein